MKAKNAGYNSWEHPRLSGIKIQEIKNKARNVEYGISYEIRVPAKITGGKRKRFQCQNKQDAFNLAEKTYRAYQREGTSFSKLSTEEKHQAALALKIAKESGFDIVDMVKFAKTRMKPIDERKTFRYFVDELYQIKLKCDLKEVSLSDFKDRSHRLSEYIGDCDIVDLNKEDISYALSNMTNKRSGEPLSKRSVKNYKMVLSEVLRLAITRKYIQESPMDEFDAQEKKMLWGSDKNTKGKEPSILSVDESEKMLFTALENPQLELLGTMILGFFCGLRTEELKGIEWKHLHIIDEEEPFIEVPKGLGKGRYIRNVSIPPIALIWLSLCEQSYDKVSYPKTTSHSTYGYRFQRLCKFAGFEKWGRDRSNAIRHSYGTYLYNLTGSIEMIMANMGHQKDTTLFNHYRALTTKRDAKNYFQIGISEIDKLREHVKDKQLWNLGIFLLNKPKPTLHYTSIDLDESTPRIQLVA